MLVAVALLSVWICLTSLRTRGRGSSLCVELLHLAVCLFPPVAYQKLHCEGAEVCGERGGGASHGQNCLSTHSAISLHSRETRLPTVTLLSLSVPPASSPERLFQGRRWAPCLSRVLEPLSWHPGQNVT